MGSLACTYRGNCECKEPNFIVAKCQSASAAVKAQICVIGAIKHTGKISPDRVCVPGKVNPSSWSNRTGKEENRFHQRPALAAHSSLNEHIVTQLYQSCRLNLANCLTLHVKQKWYGTCQDWLVLSLVFILFNYCPT